MARKRRSTRISLRSLVNALKPRRTTRRRRRTTRRKRTTRRRRR